MEYHMKLSQTMGSISMEKQRSYYNNSIFNTTSFHLTVLRPMEHLKNVEEEHKELQGMAPTNYLMHSGGTEHQFDLPQEPLLIH